MKEEGKKKKARTGVARGKSSGRLHRSTIRSRSSFPVGKTLAAISSSRESIVEFVLQSRRLVYRRYTSCTVREIEDLEFLEVQGFVRRRRKGMHRTAPVPFSRFPTGICTCKDRAEQIAARRACRSVYRAVYLRAA